MLFLFKEYNLRKVWAGTVSNNNGMLKIMAKSGMVKDGVRKKQRFIDNKELDIIYSAKFSS